MPRKKVRCRQCQGSCDSLSKLGLCRPCYLARIKKPIPLCKKCGIQISNQSDSGYCRSCVNFVFGDRWRYSKGNKCKECGSRIANWNDRDICPRCNHRKDSYIRLQRIYGAIEPEPPKEILPKIQCRHKYCRKRFRPTNRFERYCSGECRGKALNSDAGWAYRNGFGYVPDSDGVRRII